MERTEQVPVEAIRLDGGTQQRPIDPAIVNQYRELRQDGVDLPPIEVVYDDTNACYWLWDGFHRLAAAQELSRKKIRAHVRDGSQRDAVWLSYSANKAHGLRRPAGTAKRVIEQILCDPEWSKTPLAQIAEHVGVSRQYVQGVRDALLSQTEDRREVDEQSGKNRTDDGKNGAHGATSCTIPAVGIVQNTPARSDSIEVTRDGKTYTQKSQEKREAKAATDADGRPIPAHLLPVFATQDQFREFAQTLSTLKGQVHQAIEANPVAWSRFNENAFRSGMSKLHDLLSLSGPHIICAYCSGEQSNLCGTDGCKGTGFLTRAQARCVPEDLKKTMPEVKS